MQKHLEILQRAISLAQDQSQAAALVMPAAELSKKLDLSLSNDGSDLQQLEQAVIDYLNYNPNSAHPEFFKLLYSGQNKDALLGDWVASLSNATMHTYQVGPVATLMELELIKQWNRLIGFDNGEGVMVSGGTQANIVGMMLARHQACPEFQTKGYSALNNRNLIAYVSDQSHYSNLRAANTLGIGTDNLRSIESDKNGRLIPSALEQAIEEDIQHGHRPFFIGLTAGTTVTGAFDPVKPCKDIALAHKIWLHIDGAWGAPVLFSDQHKHLLADCQLADSFAWDAHKLMNVPITAAVILVKQQGALKNCTAGGGGDYLFHNDINADFNLGQRSLQCGRRADSLKVWLSWKAAGNAGFATKVDYLQNLKTTAIEMIKSSPSLEMLAQADYLNVLFRYSDDALSETELAVLNSDICKRMHESGRAYIDYAKYKGRTGIRLILANQEAQPSHIENLLRNVSDIGMELANVLRP